MLNEHGWEIPDNTPVEIPSRLRLPQSRAQQIQAFIRQELSRHAMDEGHESWEEANDLEVDEFDQFGMTAYERSAEFGQDDQEYVREVHEAVKKPAAEPPADPPKEPPKDEAA